MPQISKTCIGQSIIPALNSCRLGTNLNFIQFQKIIVLLLQNLCFWTPTVYHLSCTHRVCVLCSTGESNPHFLALSQYDDKFYTVPRTGSAGSSNQKLVCPGICSTTPLHFRYTVELGKAFQACSKIRIITQCAVRHQGMIYFLFVLGWVPGSKSTKLAP